MIVFAPVPPLRIATVPVTLFAFVEILPNILDPLTETILSSVTLKSLIFSVFIALLLIIGALAVLPFPFKSPSS